MSVAFSFLIEIYDNASTGTLDRRLGRSHFLGTFTFDTVKHVTADTLRMDPTEHIFLPPNIAHYKRDRLGLTVIIKYLGKNSESGFEFTFSKSNVHSLQYALFSNDCQVDKLRFR
jgi:hypothetical protein